MTWETLQETSESERRAVISAQELAAALQVDMSQATTTCDSRTDEVIELTKVSPIERSDFTITDIATLRIQSMEQIPSTSIASSETRSVFDEITSKRNQRSSNSLKVSFLREVIPGTNFPWLTQRIQLPENNLPTSVGEMDHSGSVFDKHLKLLVRRSPKESWRLYRQIARERSTSQRRLSK